MRAAVIALDNGMECLDTATHSCIPQSAAALRIGLAAEADELGCNASLKRKWGVEEGFDGVLFLSNLSKILTEGEMSKVRGRYFPFKPIEAILYRSETMVRSNCERELAALQERSL